MMGDDMAVLSGGMYGDPESSYTMAIPQSVSRAGRLKSNAGMVGNVAGAGLNMFGSLLEMGAMDKQYAANIAALKEERQYNLENYEQYIADLVASNKISFWSSGLDINSGTARQVIESNRQAAIADKNMMLRNYDTEIKSMKEKRKANEIAGMFNIASSALSII